MFVSNPITNVFVIQDRVQKYQCSCVLQIKNFSTIKIHEQPNAVMPHYSLRKTFFEIHSQNLQGYSKRERSGMISCCHSNHTFRCNTGTYIHTTGALQSMNLFYLRIEEKALWRSRSKLDGRACWNGSVGGAQRKECWRWRVLVCVIELKKHGQGVLLLATQVQ